jgi:hypothetical protein
MIVSPRALFAPISGRDHETPLERRGGRGSRGGCFFKFRLAGSLRHRAHGDGALGHGAREPRDRSPACPRAGGYLTDALWPPAGRPRGSGWLSAGRRGVPAGRRRGDRRGAGGAPGGAGGAQAGRRRSWLYLAFTFFACDYP